MNYISPEREFNKHSNFQNSKQKGCVVITDKVMAILLILCREINRMGQILV